MFHQVSISFEAPIQTQRVICTGFYDEWCGKTEMQETVVNKERGTKSYSILLNLPLKQSTVVFKFIVDGCWQLSPAYGRIFSGEFENNVLECDAMHPVDIDPVKIDMQDKAKEDEEHSLVPQNKMVPHDSAMEMTEDAMLNKVEPAALPNAESTGQPVPARIMSKNNSRKQCKGKGKGRCSRSGKRKGKGKGMTW